MKYKLFISDYDGTLGVAPKNDIDSETVSAIKKFTEQGGIFVVCSGRETTSITRILRESNLDKGLLVSFQGARITDLNTGENIFDGGLDDKVAIDILNSVEYSGLTPLAYVGSTFFYNELNPYTERYENAVRLKGFVTDVKEYIRENKLKTSKICWLGEDKTVNEVADQMNEKYKGSGVKFNSGAKNLLEAINVNCSKGVAVKFLAKYYGVSLNEVIAVGDSTNDIDLISGAWHGVAVGDGREELKAVADEITVPFDEKPVLTLLKKYCLD